MSDSIEPIAGTRTHMTETLAPRQAQSHGADTLGVTADPELFELDSVLADRYLIQEHVASGGMGVVLRVLDQKLQRELALKLVRPAAADNADLIRRFLDEAAVCGRLQHPGVVPLHDVDRLPDGRPYFTMKLVHGQTLARLLAARGTPADDLPRLLKIFEQICQAVAYAHSLGFIHRDLKPANIMVGEFGEVQVMDWGLAKQVRSSGAPVEPAPLQDAASDLMLSGCEEIGALPSGPSPEGRTQAGRVLGTLAYMPPEQARGEVGQLDERCDVFGLGAILCEILTGRPPYVAVGAAQLFALAASGDLDNALDALGKCGADPELVGLTSQCLNPDRDGRPPHAGALAAELTAYLDSVAKRLRQAELAGAEAKARSEEERKRRRVTLGAGIAVVAIVITAGTIWIGYRHQQQTRTAQMAGQVGEVLREAQSYREKADATTGDQLPLRMEALAAVKRAQVLADSGNVDAPLRSRVEDLKTQIEHEAETARRVDNDRRFLARLMDIRTRAGDDLRSNGDQDFARADSRYNDAFREYGLDVRTWGPLQARSWAAERGPEITTELAASLDDWAHTRRVANWGAANIDKQQMDLARALDPDPLRDKIRAAIGAAQLPALRDLSRSRAVLTAPAPTVNLLAVALGFAKDYPGAIRLLRAAQRRYPSDFQINHNLGWFLIRTPSESPEEALRFTQAAVALRPRSAAAWLNLLEIQQKRGKVSEALDTLEELGRTHTVGALPHYLRGIALLRKNQRDEAIEALTEATRIEPDHDAAFHTLGIALAGAGRNAEAAAAFAESLRLRPGDPSRKADLAGALIRQGKKDEAFTILSELIRQEPWDSWRVQSMFVDVLYRTRPFDEALKLFGSDELTAAVNCEARYGYACLLLRFGKTAEHRKLCAGFRLPPDRPGAWREAHIMARTAALGSGSGVEPSQLIEMASAALRVQPNFSHHWHVMGLAQLRAGDAQKALQAAQTAIAKDKNWVPGLNQLLLALAHHGLGKTEDARRCLAAARTLPPGANEHYHDRWAYPVLMHEAETLIGK